MSEYNKFNSTNVNKAKPPIINGREYIKLYLENIKSIFKSNLNLDNLSDGIYDYLIKDKGCIDYVIKIGNCDELIIDYLSMCKPEFTFSDEFNEANKVIRESVDEIFSKNKDKFLENGLNNHKVLYGVSLYLFGQKTNVDKLSKQELEENIKSYIGNKNSSQKKFSKEYEKRIINENPENKIPPEVIKALLLASLVFTGIVAGSKIYYEKNEQKQNETKPKIGYVGSLNINTNNGYDSENNEYIVRR